MSLQFHSMTFLKDWKKIFIWAMAFKSRNRSEKKIFKYKFISVMSRTNQRFVFWFYFLHYFSGVWKGGRFRKNFSSANGETIRILNCFSHFCTTFKYNCDWRVWVMLILRRLNENIRFIIWNRIENYFNFWISGSWFTDFSLRKVTTKSDAHVSQSRGCCATTSMWKVELELEFNFLSGCFSLSLSAAGD